MGPVLCTRVKLTFSKNAAGEWRIASTPIDLQVIRMIMTTTAYVPAALSNGCMHGLADLNFIRRNHPLQTSAAIGRMLVVSALALALP